jgi:hypothetical protein
MRPEKDRSSCSENVGRVGLGAEGAVQSAVHIVCRDLELEAMEVSKPLCVCHFRFQRLGLWKRLPGMRLAYVHHDEANAVSIPAVQLVESRGSVVCNGTSAGAKDEQSRAGLGEVAGAEAATTHGREVELRHAVTRTGIIFAEAEIAEHQRER